MNMKSHITAYLLPLIIIFSVLTGAASCTSSVDGIYGSFPFLTVTEDSITTIGKDGGTLTIPLSTNRDLTASCSDSWLRVNSISRDNLVLSAEPNDEENPRTTTVRLYDKNNTVEAQFAVTQEESGIKTSTGNTLLQSSEEITHFIQEYTRVSGNLIFGSTGGNVRSSTVPASETDEYTTSIGGTSYTFYRSASISNTDLASFSEYIREVQDGGIYLILNTAVSDIRPLLSYGISEWTLVGNDNLTSVQALADQSGIRSLTIKHSPMIQDFESISGMSGLTYLDISKNGIEDISFLEGLQLETLVLGSAQGESNTIRDISVLHSMTTLRSLVISGLPIPQEQIDELQSSIPDCEITSQNMPNDIPELGDILFTPSVNSIVLSCSIADVGSSGLIEKGFYFGPSMDNLSKYIDGSESQSEITVTVEDLDSSSFYYVRAYAQNELGTATADTTVYTIGRPVLEGNTEVTVSVSTLSIKATMSHPGNPASVEFGTLIGRSPEVSIDNYLDIISHRNENGPLTEIPYTWQDTYTGETGSIYYVRTYARVEGYDITYGDPVKAETEGRPESTSTVHLNLSLPAWASPADAEVEPPKNFYGYYFRDDIVGSGETVYGTKEAEGLFEFSFFQGIQDIVFSNTEGQPLSGGSDYLQWNTSAESTLPQDLLIYSQTDTDIQDASINLKATPERVSAALSIIRFAYFDANGTQCTDLSSVISSIRITAKGISSSYTIASDGSGRYSGNGTLALDTDVISNTQEQILCQGLHVLPSANRQSFNITVELTLAEDGSTVSRTAVFKALEANHAYDLTINLYNFNNETGGQFKIDIIENIDKEIEF